ncbi:MAG: sigma-70 family RNA polymerase sigma factor [Candidatus Magnetomorum sp.]|nr:sigma-70 family RNA polymerase sigma factor [Candidatus Magnetomorum sp.]
MKQNDKDRQILHQCLKQNNQAPLVQEYWRMVFFTVRKVLLNKRVPFCEQDLENLRNDVFVQLLDKKCKKLRQYNEDLGQGLTAWIKLIAVHTTLNYIERKDPVGIGSQHALVPLETIQEKMGVDIEAQMDARLTLNRVQNSLKLLPSRYQLVLKLFYFDNVSIEKVAQTIQLPVKRAHTVLHRAREKLKKVMDEKKE